MSEAEGARATRAAPRATTVIRLVLPLTAFVTLIVSPLFVFPRRGLEFIGYLGAYMAPPAGKETVIPALVGVGFEPFMVATYIAGLDMTLGWLLAWNWDLVTHLPAVGPACDRLMEKGRARLAEQRLLDRSAFLGLTLFVFLPMQGTGAIAGTALGRMVGLPPQRAWLAVMLGALAGAFAWAYAADAVRDAVRAFGGDLVLQVTVLVISSATLIGLVVRRVRRG